MILYRDTIIQEFHQVEHPSKKPGLSKQLELSPGFSFPAESQCWMGIPLIAKGKVIGLLSVGHDRPDCYTSQTAQLTLAFAHQVAQALENARLYKQGQSLAALEERQRLARDLHDAVTQTLFSANLVADVLPEIWEQDPEEGKHMLHDLRRMNKGALAEMRTMLMELRPMAFGQAELPNLLRQLVQAARGRTSISVELVIEGEELLRGRLSGPVLDVFYRVTQEALNNVIHHSRASQAAIRLRGWWERVSPDETEMANLQGDDPALIFWVELVVEDNGIGFPVFTEEEGNENVLGSEHFGLSIMKERAKAVGAHLEIYSHQPGSRIDNGWIKSTNIVSSGTIIRMIWKSTVGAHGQEGWVGK